MITGYRWWHAVLVPGRPGGRAEVPALESWSMRYYWQPGVNRATCALEPMGGNCSHVAPDHDCECGFWALSEPAWLSTAATYEWIPHIFGEVELWGRSFFTTNGTRAEYARIVSLSVPSPPALRVDRLARRIARRYDVPLVPFPIEGPPGADFGRSIGRGHNAAKGADRGG